jgi:penicillin-binding protein 1B
VAKKATSFRKRLIKRLPLLLLALAVVAMAGLAVYGGYLAVQIDGRFSSRRWQVPSTVYSDSTLLFPGQGCNHELFIAKLEALGYRRVNRPPAFGEYRLRPGRLEVFLHDLETPSQTRSGFPVQIALDRNRIGAITDQRSGRALPLLELEPEKIGLFFGAAREQRKLVAIDQVPRPLIQAVLAAEDSRFYHHHGVDPRGLLRALWANLRAGGIRQGGSTITQQLSKNYFLTPERTLSRKLKELLMALLIDARYAKDEILEIYLNEIYLGQKGSVSINGIGEAADFYFGKPVATLSLTEAAALAGLIKAPNLYSPHQDLERCRNRRDTVLRAMAKNGWLTADALHDALETPLTPAGFRTYHRMAPYFMDYLSEQLGALYSPEALASMGMSIYTTLDTQIQSAAETALLRGLARLEKSPGLRARRSPAARLQGAVVVMQPKTGHILAMVGGRDYAESQFNRVSQARRQPGSTFKPFVFLAGLKRFTPASRLSNRPRVYEIDGRRWEPQNFEREPAPELSFRQALAHSANRATVSLAMQTGLDAVVATAEDFQFSTRLRPLPAMALGAFEVIPLELARAYCTFPAGGLEPYPLALKAVVNEAGQVLERRHMSIERVISPAAAFIMNSLLASVVTEGTAISLARRGITFPVAGKTGTTNNSRDAWFVGYTPELLALVWVGFDDGASIHASGPSAALPIWADLLTAIPQTVSGAWFSPPPGVVQRRVCRQSGQLALKACPTPMVEYFLETNAPTTPCPLHRRSNPLRKFFDDVQKRLPHK